MNRTTLVQMTRRHWQECLQELEPDDSEAREFAEKEREFQDIMRDYEDMLMGEQPERPYDHL
jgi:hypothetical protein